MTLNYESIEATDEKFDFEPSYDEISDDVELDIPDEIIEEESEEDDGETYRATIRKRLILKMYLNEFPEKLKSYKRMKSKIEGMDLEELDNLRSEFEMCVGMKTSIKGMTNMAIRGVMMLEKTIEAFTPLNPTGLAQVCSSDEGFNDDLKLVCLKYCEYINAAPEARLGMTLLSNIIMMDKINKIQNMMADDPQVQQKINESNGTFNDINQEFGDI